MTAAKKTTVPATTTEFKKVEVSAKEGQPKGELKVLKAKELQKAGITGIIAEGIFETRKADKFNEGNFEYWIRGNDGTLFLLKDTKSLREQFDEILDCEGCKIRVEYLGAKKTKDGKRDFHEYAVSVA